MSNKKIQLESVSFLIPACRSGEAFARQELFDFLKGYLENVADGCLDHKSKRKVGVSDIVQNSFVRIIEKFDQFRGQTTGELKAWIKTVVQNEANGVRRKFSTNKRDMHREVSIAAKDSVSPGINLVDGKTTPSSGALKSEQNQKFHEILSQLSPDDSTVIRLRSIEELSFKEIAVQMNRSHEAVSQLWYRAILKFESRLRASGEFNES